MALPESRHVAPVPLPGTCSNCKKRRPAPGRKLCSYCLENARRKMQARKAAGRCYECGAPVDKGHTRCRPCLNERKHIRARLIAERTRAGLCITCGDPAMPADAGPRCLNHYFCAIAALANHRIRTAAKVSGDDLAALWKKQAGLCAYTGLRLLPGAGKDHPLAASLDHKISRESGGGNDITNLHWTACGVNGIKGRLTDGEFRYILGRAGLKRLAAIILGRGRTFKMMDRKAA
jgi:hypothetical protein